MIDQAFEPESSAPPKPSAKVLLDRINSVDTTQFELKRVEQDIMGNKVWVNALTIPVTMVSLVVFTFLGAWFSGYIFISFIVSAFFVFIIGKLFEGYENQFKWQARQEVERRISETEGSEGLIIHFKSFLPTRYRHLIQCLKKGNTQYIDQYIQAVSILQRKLDKQKFTHAWQLAYPETEITPAEPTPQTNTKA